VLAAKRLDDVAIPADRVARGKDVGKLLGTNLGPFDGLAVGSQQGGSVIRALERAKALVAIRALLAFVPAGNDVPEEAALRVRLDLREALLSAMVALGPAGAAVQAEFDLADKSCSGSFPRRNIHGCRLARFRAGHEAFAAISEVGAHGRDGAVDEQADDNDSEENGEDEWGGQASPPGGTEPYCVHGPQIAVTRVTPRRDG